MYAGVLTCLNKKTGEIVWEHKGFYAWSSPVCVYNSDGSGRVLYCTCEGLLYLLDAEKGKVHVLMALLNQKTTMAAMNAEPLALDPHGRDNQLTVAGDPSPEFTISFAEDGSLKVDCKLVLERPPSIDVADGKGGYDTLENLGAGSKVEASFSLGITPQELDRLAAVDYSKYDGARMTQHVLDPNAERPYETVRQVLDQDFRFASDNDAVTCRTGYKITVA